MKRTTTLPALFLTLFALCIFTSMGYADTVLCTESDFGVTNGNAAGSPSGENLMQGGCVNTLPALFGETPAIPIVASDGEVTFTPFGTGTVTTGVSDAILLGSDWIPDLTFAPGFWTQCNICIPTNEVTVWYLPANTPCGSENEPTCEPIAAWFVAGSSWPAAALGTYVINDASGGVSGKIVLNNVDCTGQLFGCAELIFSSDPNLVPEPALGLPVGALLLAGLYFRRRVIPRGLDISYPKGSGVTDVKRGDRNRGHLTFGLPRNG